MTNEASALDCHQRAGNSPPTSVREAARHQPAKADICEFVVDALPPHEASGFVEAWRALATQSLEANAFLEPDFALAAAGLYGARVRFLFVWTGKTRTVLAAVCAVVAPRPFPGSLATLWMHENATCSTPLLDPAHSDRALRAILAACRRHWPLTAGLRIGGLDPSGPVAGQLCSLGRPFRFDTPFERPVLDLDHNRNQTESYISRTCRKCRRKLEREGHLAFRTFCGHDETTAAVEAFLVLEARGWKGRRGALLSRDGLAAFARAAVAGLSAQRRCRIVSLELDQRPIAMGIVFVSGGRAFFWKIAYDETYAAFSPGALLTIDLTKSLLAEGETHLADSCADVGNRMIAALWPQRRSVATLYVGLGNRAAFGLAVALDVAKVAARRRLKGYLQGLRKMARRRRQRATVPAATVRTP